MPLRRYELTEGGLSLLVKKRNKSKPTLYPDNRCRGLVAIAQPSGQVSWAVRGDIRENGKRVRSVRRVIGNWPELSVGSAREIARTELQQIRRVLPKDDPSEWTVRQAFEAHLQRNIGAKSRKDYNGYMRRSLAGLADTRLRDLRRKDVTDLHETISQEHPKSADKVLAALRAFYNTALRKAELGTLPPNPVPLVVEFHHLGAEDQPDIPDLGLWFKQLAAVPNRGRALMFEFGIYSGLRPGLLRELRREWFVADTLVIPRSEMGKAKRRDGSFRVPLSKTMLRIVADALRYAEAIDPSSAFLFPGPRRGRPWSEKKEPSLVTGKPLRRAHFQIAIKLGISLPVAEMLADRVLPSAGRFYLRDPEDEKRAAQDQITNFLDGLRAMV